MSIEQMTFGCALDSIANRGDVPLRDRAAYLYDLVYQAADQYTLREGLAGSKDEVSRKSLGKKLAYFGEDGHNEVRQALKKFRSLRLRCEKKGALADDLLCELHGKASEIVELAGVKDCPCVNRVPLEVRTVNSVSIETLQGYRSFDILHADVTQIPGDLLVISTHANPDELPSGQLVNALRKEDITVDPDRLFQIVDKERVWTCFQQVDGHPLIRNVLTARMKKSRDLEDPTAFFDTAVQGIFSSVAALEYLGHRFRVINLPVIYGQRIVDYHASIESLVRHALVWLKRSDYTEKVNFVVYNFDDLSQWDSALNEVLGRSFITPGSDLVLEGIVKEVIPQLAQAATGPLSGAAGPLLQSLEKADNVCIENICVFGRKLCELLASDLLTRNDLKSSPILINNIETLREAKVVAPWICSYMHSLRIFGNETVHTRSSVRYVPTTLDQNDLIAALSAIKSLLAFWYSEFGGYPGR